MDKQGPGGGLPQGKGIHSALNDKGYDKLKPVHNEQAGKAQRQEKGILPEKGAKGGKALEGPPETQRRRFGAQNNLSRNRQKALFKKTAFTKRPFYKQHISSLLPFISHNQAIANQGPFGQSRLKGRPHILTGKQA
jgi:hypothetical protein